MARKNNKITGRRKRELRQIAIGLLDAKLSRSAIEDPVSICDTVSHGVKKIEKGNSVWCVSSEELTLDEAEIVLEYIEEIQEVQRVNRIEQTAITALTVIDCTDAAEFDVQAVKTYPDTIAGQDAAKECFAEWMRDSAANPEEITDEQVDAAWEDGKYEVGEGFIAVIRS